MLTCILSNFQPAAWHRAILICTCIYVGVWFTYIQAVMRESFVTFVIILKVGPQARDGNFRFGSVIRCALARWRYSNDEAAMAASQRPFGRTPLDGAANPLNAPVNCILNEMHTLTISLSNARSPAVDPLKFPIARLHRSESRIPLWRVSVYDANLATIKL